VTGLAGGLDVAYVFVSPNAEIYSAVEICVGFQFGVKLNATVAPLVEISLSTVFDPYP